MKLRLMVSAEKYDETARELAALGIEIDDRAELILCEKKRISRFSYR